MSPVRALPVRPATPTLTLRAPPPVLASPVTLGERAWPLLTDFRASPAIAVAADMPVDRALEHMILAGVRFCFVAAPNGTLEGTVTSFDLQGEKVVRLLQARGRQLREGSPREITVRDVMEPLHRLPTLDARLAEQATLEEIVATMRRVRTRHLVVVEDRPGGPVLRGLFSATRIEQASGLALDIVPGPATFAEIEQAVEHPA